MRQYIGVAVHTLKPGRPVGCSEGYTTRLKLPHWVERSDIYVHFHTTESLGGDDLYDIPAIL